MEAAMTEMFKNANQEYLQKSYSEGSPTDFADYLGAMNTPKFRAIPFGSSHGSGTAASVAKLFGIPANGGVYDGKQVLSKKSIAALETPAMTNKDQMIGMKTSRGMGTWLIPVVVNDNFDKPVQMFGHPGVGGQFGCGDSSTQLGVGYTSNYLDMGPKRCDWTERYANLLYATYDCINVLEGVSVKRKAYVCLGTMEDDIKEVKV